VKLDLEHNPVLISLMTRLITYVLGASGLAIYLPSGSAAQVATAIGAVVVALLDVLVSFLVRSKVASPATRKALAAAAKQVQASGLSAADVEQVFAGLTNHRQVVAQIVADGVAEVAVAAVAPAPRLHPPGLAPWPDPQAPDPTSVSPAPEQAAPQALRQPVGAVLATPTPTGAGPTQAGA